MVKYGELRRQAIRTAKRPGIGFRAQCEASRERRTIASGHDGRRAAQARRHRRLDRQKRPPLEAHIDAETQRGGIKDVAIDMAAVEHLDTFGAWLLEKLMRAFADRGGATQVTGLKEDYRPLVDEVHGVVLEKAPSRRPNQLAYALAAIGHSIVSVGQMSSAPSSTCWARSASRCCASPRGRAPSASPRWCISSTWSAGAAVPIILLITFLVGCIIAQQGIFHFRKFGADIYVVDMVGILVLREIGVLIVSIMVAGRSGSAYTAELGSMKMREEIDALRTMGFDPVEVLILPRIVALIIGVPILTFLGSMAALYGGGLVVLALWRHRARHFPARLHEAISLNISRSA